MKETDWSDVFLVAHHMQFDGFILAHHFGITPRMYGCTLSMARMCVGTHVSASLDSIRAIYGLPPKHQPYNLFKGKHWYELSRDVQQQIAEGLLSITLLGSAILIILLAREPME